MNPVERALASLRSMSAAADQAVEMVRRFPCPRHVFLEEDRCVFCGAGVSLGIEKP